MGVTLVAILTAALLLPGIIAARYFYRAAQTVEVEPAPPSLSSAEGIALIGIFSVVVHLVYVIGLRGVAALPPVIPLPLADPYRLFATRHPGLTSIDATLALFEALGLLCVTALIIGYLCGRVVMLRGDKSIFYGPLSDVLARGAGGDRFIIAYVLVKLEDEARMLGYQGTVVSLIRDGDRFPAKVVLKDASIFTLVLTPDGPERREAGGVIDWIALSAADWHNIAFRVFRVADEAADPIGE